ncbi:transglutaminase domain-containing protein [Cellulomonas sp. NPDC089187]|uniref:transglutaminase domain-containing protein n=1 Tax=Cellulomonas sp. NPDC089187 TaxID=3154970 RepID=UPI003425604E
MTPPPPGGAAPSPRPRRTRRSVLTALVTVVAVALGTLAAVRFWPERGPWLSAEDLADQGLSEVIEDVPLTDSVPVPVDFDPSSVPADQALAVYLDRDLTVRAPDAQIADTADGYAATPQTSTAWAGAGAQQIGVESGSWGFAQVYYLALLVDPGTGEPVEEPQVSAFTVRTPVAAPTLDVTVDDDGVGQVGWQPVDGATGYRVLRLGSDGVRVLHSETDPGWATTEQPITSLASSWSAQSEHQHEDLVTVRYSDDALRGDDFIEDNPTDQVTYLVQTVTTENRASGVATVPTDLPARLPDAVAVHALAELGLSLDQPIDPGTLPAQVPVSMADGRTRMFPVSYLAEPVSAAGGWGASMTVDGTRFRLTIPITSADVGSAQQAIQAASERADQARTDAADPPAEYAYQQPAAVVLSEVEISDTAPEVPYPVHGTTEFVRFLSAQLIAGKQYVDLSAYMAGRGMSATDGTDLWDAFYEAAYQTPMALAYARVDAVYLPDQQVLVLTYADSPEQRAADQAALSATVQDTVARIITPDMSETERVRAINAHLLSVAAYDDDAYDAQLGGNADAYPQAWLPTGVLLHGTGVCVSYASAFQALADAAGLDSVMVTGVAVDGGEGHAWNKVWVDGAWRVVDSTWNDSPWVGSERFFLQTDAQAAADRSEDQDWIVDANQPMYAAG